MQVGQFPASAATSLLEGYRDDFVSLAASLSQTLEQMSERRIKLDPSLPTLEQLEAGMRQMATTIRELLDRSAAPTNLEVALRRETPQRQAAPTALAAENKKDAPPKLTARLPVTAARPASPPAAPAAPPRPASPAVPAAVPLAAPVRPAVAQQPPPQPSSPVREVFESLERDRRSGTLFVQAGRETLAFVFVAGCITQTASDNQLTDERLGDLLVELGHCTRERLASAFARLNPSENRLLGEILVREGAVTNRQIVEALEHQVQRRVRRACAISDALFDFADGNLLPDDGRVQVPPSAMLR